jgi:hypothetical protein
MTNSSSTKERSRDSALAFAWGQYRVFAATSRALKAELSAWRLRVLILSISGAILGSLCQQSTGWGLEGGKFSLLPTLFGILSAAALALAAYFGKELLDPERERNWVRARSMAESLKAEAYLFSAKATPYNNTDAIDLLFKRTEELLESADDIQTKTISSEKKSKGLLPADISVEQYMEIRVDEQIEDYYIPSALKNEKIIKRGRRISLGLGILAVVLGALGASGWTAAWVAVVTTFTLAIAAYLYAGRYQYLLISYQATARRLDLLRSRWQASGMTDDNEEERNKFIRECEDAISIENNAWMAEWTKKQEKGK